MPSLPYLDVERLDLVNWVPAALGMGWHLIQVRNLWELNPQHDRKLSDDWFDVSENILQEQATLPYLDHDLGFGLVGWMLDWTWTPLVMGGPDLFVY